MHSSSSPSLTIQDLNRLLFEMEPTSAVEYNENNSGEFNNNNEQDETSEFVMACRLIVSSHRAYKAAALSLGESSSVVQGKGPEPNSLLASIIGDLVPAAEAVIGDNSLFNNSSLMNSTPFMDSTPYMDPAATPYMDTPYLDPTTPFMDPTATPYTPFTPTITPSMNGTPHFSPYIDSCKDIPMANYLVHDDLSNLMDCANNNACSASTLNRGSQSAIEQTLASFSGDPAQLLLDKGKSTINSTTMHANSAPLTWHDEPAAESSDMLFPPLPGDSQPSSSDMDFDFGNDEDHTNGFMDELLGFDFSGSVTATSNNVEQSGSNANGDSKSNNNTQSSNEESKENDDTASSNVNESSAASSTSAVSTNKRKRASAAGSDNTQIKRRRNTKASSNTNLVNEKRYECDICKLKFSRRYNLGTHIKTHDKNRQKEFMCDVCPKGFDRKHDRDRHVATVHHGERSYACDRCTASFSRKDALSRHLDHKHGVV